MQLCAKAGQCGEREEKQAEGSERHPPTAHDKTVDGYGRTPRRVTGSGLRLPGREDRGFQYVCVLPGYNATSGIGVKR